jgi:hypothetical protein
MLHRPSGEALGEPVRHRGGAPLDHEVEVGPIPGSIQEEVPDQAADGGDAEAEAIPEGPRDPEELSLPPAEALESRGHGQREACRQRGVPENGTRGASGAGHQHEGPIGPERAPDHDLRGIGSQEHRVPEDCEERRLPEAEIARVPERLPRGAGPAAA